MPLDTQIALGVRPLQLADPLAREGQVQNILAAQAQQRAAGTQQQHSQLQMEQMQRQLQQDESYVSRMADAIGKNGGPPDIMQAFQIMSTNRNPQISQHGITGLQSLQRLDEAKKAGIYGAPTDLATPAPASVVNQLTPPAAAPVNQLAATPQADAAKTLQTEYMKLSQFTDVPGVKERMDLIKEQLKELSTPRVVGRNLVTGAGNVLFTAPQDVALSTLAKLQAERTALPADDPRRAAYDAAIAKESQFAPHAPPPPSTLAKLQNEMAELPPGDPRRAQYISAINKEITRAPGTVVNIDQKQESAFATGLGSGQAKAVLESKTGAQDAAEILRTNQVGRDLLKSGAITGTGANFFVGFNNALKQAGVDFGYADASANSQAYAAAMGANVGRIIKQFGAGTGLSDADREYAAQMAGGRISLTEPALRRILEINDKAANRVIDLHNKNVSGIKTNIPLTVEKPASMPVQPPGASLIPGSTSAAGGGATVTLPDGRIKTFPNAAAADQFKKAAGL